MAKFLDEEEKRQRRARGKESGPCVGNDEVLLRPPVGSISQRVSRLAAFSHRGARFLCLLLPRFLSLAGKIRHATKRSAVSRRAAFPQTLTASARGEAPPRGLSTARGARSSRTGRGNIFVPIGARVPILTCGRESHSRPTGPTPPRAHDVDSAPFFLGLRF